MGPFSANGFKTSRHEDTQDKIFVANRPTECASGISIAFIIVCNRAPRPRSSPKRASHYNRRLRERLPKRGASNTIISTVP